MECKLVIDKNEKERVVIYAKEKTPEIERIIKLVEGEEKMLVGYDDDRIIPLDPEAITAFISETGGVYAVMGKKKIAVRDRLYSLEERLGRSFLRINQSCLANVSKIARFEATLGAALAVIFKDGYRDYVSRRQLKHVKERIGF